MPTRGMPGVSIYLAKDVPPCALTRGMPGDSSVFPLERHCQYYKIVMRGDTPMGHNDA